MKTEVPVVFQVKLQYERVPVHRQPHVHHLDDPVTELMVLTRPIMSHVLTDLPRGKYIVCGEAVTGEGEGYQHNCFETRIARAETDSEYSNISHSEAVTM